MIFQNIDAALKATPFAIFNGRGGSNTHNPSHQEFLDKRDEMKHLYNTAKGHKGKKKVYDAMIDWVENDKNGKFYEKQEDGTCKEMPRHITYKKISAAFRDKRKKKSSMLCRPPVHMIQVTRNDIAELPSTSKTSECNQALSLPLPPLLDWAHESSAFVDPLLSFHETAPIHIGITKADRSTLHSVENANDTFILPMQFDDSNDLCLDHLMDDISINTSLLQMDREANADDWSL
jgi:hypothetical protein